MRSRAIYHSGILFLTAALSVLLAFQAFTKGPAVFGDAPTDLAASAKFGQNPDEFPVAELRGDAPKGCELISKGAEANSIRLTAEMSLVNRLGSPITIRLNLCNGRDEDIFLNHYNDGADFYLYLVDRDRKSVPWATVGKQMLPYALYSQFSNRLMTLHPHENIVREYDIAQYFSIEKAGAYRLRIVRTIDGTSSIPLLGSLFEIDLGAIDFEVRK